VVPNGHAAVPLSNRTVDLDPRTEVIAIGAPSPASSARARYPAVSRTARGAVDGSERSVEAMHDVEGQCHTWHALAGKLYTAGPETLRKGTRVAPGSSRRRAPRRPLLSEQAPRQPR
jgi:hypothetical protein